MTANNVFEYALIELNKVQAPSLLLEDYNYFINKAINQYINKQYNLYDMNQQKSDDVRVLKSTAVLTPSVQTVYDGVSPTKSPLYGTTYEVNLPDDYLHILNCVAEYQLAKNYKCYDKDSYQHFGAKRLTADMFSQIINNYYLRPSYKQPYFYLHNVNTDNVFPTDDSQVNINHVVSQTTITNAAIATPVVDATTITINTKVITFKTTVVAANQVVIGDPSNSNNSIINLFNFLSESSDPLLTVATYSLTTTDSGTKKITVTPIVGETHLAISASAVTIVPVQITSSYVEKVKTAEQRYGNKSKVRMEIRYGKDDTLFKLNKIYVDYLKAPQFIRLTQDQVDQVEDNSQVLEFPDYVCQEIVNELIHLLMENASDQRLATHVPINQSIAGAPQQAQAQKD